MIPKLEQHCGSWIITRKGDAAVIGEFFDRRTVERFSPDTCLIETAAQYLGRLNSNIRQRYAAESVELVEEEEVKP